MRKVTFLVLLFSFAWSVALGSHFGDFYVVPIAGHVSGFGSSMWQTDIVVHNFETSTITVEMALVESGPGSTDNFFPVTVDGATTFTVPAGGTRVLSDVLRNHRGRPGVMGALLIGADRPFAVTSRIYNVDGSGVSIGQTVPAAQDFLSRSTDVAVIPGLIANTNFRSNIGFVAAAGATEPLVVEIALIGASGTRVGARTFTIAPGAISHFQVSSTSITTTPFDMATATLRILSGSGDVTGYASIVDNRSNHGTFVSSGVPGSAADPLQSTFVGLLEALQRAARER